MTLNTPNIDRIRELCLLIANENDPRKFQSLVEQLNHVLDGEELDRISFNDGNVPATLAKNKS